MSNKIVMKPQEMRNLSSKFSRKSGEVKSILNTLNKEVNTLSNFWDGEAKKSFINKFNSDKRKINELSNKLEMISRNLNIISKQIEDLDKILSSRM